MPRLKLPKSTGYRREFGDKQSFQKGFAQGFKAGYIDSYSGQEFRTGELLAEQGKDLPESQDGGAMETLAKSLFPVARSKTFDSGLADGYLTAYTSNDSVAFGPGLGSHASDVCRQDNPTQPVYCSGYGTGYVMGKADQQSIRSIENNDPSKLARALAVLK